MRYIVTMARAHKRKKRAGKQKNNDEINNRKDRTCDTEIVEDSRLYDGHNSKLVELEHFCLKYTCTGHQGPVPDVRFSHDNLRLASAGGDRTARVWDVQRLGQELLKFQHPTENAGVNAVSWSVDGRFVATASDDYKVRVWDIPSGKCVRELEGHTHWATSVCFSPTGNWLASCSFDESVRIWCMHTGKEIRIIPAHADPIMSLDVTNNTNFPLLLSVSLDGTSRVWDPIMGECLCTLETPKSFLSLNGIESSARPDDGSPPPAVASGCFTPNNECVLLASLDSRVRLWDIRKVFDPSFETQKVRKTYYGHLNTRHAIHTGILMDNTESIENPTGLVMVGSEDHHVYAYDLQSKNLAGILRGRENASISGDGHCDTVLGVGTGYSSPIVATSGGAADATIKVWKKEKK